MPVKWTAKLPDLLGGVALAVSGIVVICWQKSKTLTIIGILLILAGTSFIGYSMTIKNWCESYSVSSDFSSDFSLSFNDCLRQKGWFEF